MKRFDKSFSRIKGMPCWGVKRGVGTFLTLEFGEPHLDVREPVQINARSRRVRAHLARRVVSISGEWHLWIQCCEWSVLDESGNLIGDSSSAKAIERAAQYLDGQILVSSRLDARELLTIWDFDLGARLQTRPYDRSGEQWSLYEPEGKVLTLRADKKYSYGLASRERAAERWRSI